MFRLLALVLLLLGSTTIIRVDAARDITVRADAANSGIAYNGLGWHAGDADRLGDCTSGAVYRASTNIGASFSFTFTGVAVDIMSLEDFDRGIISFTLDGQDQGRIDTWSSTRTCRNIFSAQNLNNGEHTVVGTLVAKSPKHSNANLPTAFILESIIYRALDASDIPPTTAQPPPQAQPLTPSTQPSTTPTTELSQTLPSPTFSTLTSTNTRSSTPIPTSSTRPATATSSSARPSASGAPANVATTESNSNTGLIVGSILGALSAILAFLIFIWWWRRHQQRPLGARPLSLQADGYDPHYNRQSAWAMSFQFPAPTNQTANTTPTSNTPLGAGTPPLVYPTMRSNSLSSLALLQRPNDTPASSSSSAMPSPAPPPVPRPLPSYPPEQGPPLSAYSACSIMDQPVVQPRDEKDPAYIASDPGPIVKLPLTSEALGLSTGPVASSSAYSISLAGGPPLSNNEKDPALFANNADPAPNYAGPSSYPYSISLASGPPMSRNEKDPAMFSNSSPPTAWDPSANIASTSYIPPGSSGSGADTPTGLRHRHTPSATLSEATTTSRYYPGSSRSTDVGSQLTSVSRMGRGMTDEEMARLARHVAAVMREDTTLAISRAASATAVAAEIASSSGTAARNNYRATYMNEPPPQYDSPPVPSPLTHPYP